MLFLGILASHYIIHVIDAVEILIQPVSLQFLCAAVLVNISFSASFSLICLILSIGVPRAIQNAKKIINNEKKKEKD